jgi:hypothetical protein
MNVVDLLKLTEVIHDKDRRLMEQKNHDYAGDTDALTNIRPFGFMGVVVRLSDKFERLRQFALRRGPKGEHEPALSVKDESIRDTLRDIRNYAVLAEVMLDEEAK